MRAICAFLVGLLTLALGPVGPARGPEQGVIYYVSTDGSDDNDGLTPATALATVGRVNALALQPGDQVLFRCGDTWRAEMLVITWSGSAGHPITLGSYPAGCSDQPLLSGARPIGGWAPYTAEIYLADLAAGSNAGKFAYGINQLWRGGERLTLGRWPNLDAGDGYATIDAQPDGSRLSDSELPAGDWSGAVAHIRGMRWYILNRQVAADDGQTLVLNAAAGCWGSCAGWGYFLNNHLNALDREGEWYYDAAAQRVYLYTSAAPADGEVEAAVVLRDDDRAWGGIMLGQDLTGSGIAHVVVQNLAVHGWFRHGIAAPTNLAHTENHDLALLDNTITDVDGSGISLATWVYDAADGRPDGWRGGYALAVSGNVLSGANHMGIDTYARESWFTANTIRDVGQIANLGAAGLGCSLTAGEGLCTEDGDGLRIKVDQAADSGNWNTVYGNRLERIAYNGMDVFGHDNTLERNVIVQACSTKGDCGGVRTFGTGSLAETPVHDLVLRENIIVDTVGNTDGCHEDYRALFGFGLYIDHYSRDVLAAGNMIISSTAHGILYANSTGSVTANTLYNNSWSWAYGAQLYLGGAPAALAEHTANVLYGRGPAVWTLALDDPGRLGDSDGNYFFNPYRAAHIQAGGAQSLASWQAASGKDGLSHEAWFTLAPGDAPRSGIFYNDTAQTRTVDLGDAQYLDLDRQVVAGSLTLAPFQSQVLIRRPAAADLALAMAAQGGADTEPNAPLTYTLTVANLGTLTATQVVLTHTVPAEIVGTAWQAYPGGVTARAGSRYVWDLPDLAAGATAVVTVAGRFTTTLPGGTPLLLEAVVATAEPESATANNRALLALGGWQRAYLPLVGK